MNRFYSTLAVLVMTLIAVALCVRQTTYLGDDARKTTLFILEAAAALLTITVGGYLAKVEYSRYGSLVNGRRVEVLQPLRRLLSTVWS